MPRATDIMPITEFTRAYQVAIKRLRKHGRPQVLTVDGKPAVVVQDVESYERALEALDALYIEEAIGRALADTRPGVSVDEMRRRLGLPKRKTPRGEGRKKRAA